MTNPAPRIVLVNPPYRKRVMRRYVASYFAPNFLLPPVDLLSVSAAAREWLGAETRVIDSVACDLDGDAAVAQAAAFGPDWLFVQLGFFTLEEDLAFCAQLKRRLPDVPLAAMGYLPTLKPERVLEGAVVDYVVRGEPERPFTELVRARSRSRSLDAIPGLAYRRDGAMHRTAEPERITDLDALPVPDHGAVDPAHYSEPLVGKRVVTITTARGCPYGCVFCVRTYGRTLALRSAPSVIAEVEQVVREFGVTNFRFMDDTLNVDEDRLAAICDGLQRIDRPLRWAGLARLDRLNPSLCEQMRRSGCRRIYAGIETGSARLLATLDKGLTLAQVRRGVALCRDAGIEVSGFFIVGLPGETREEFEQSVALAIELDLDFVIVTRLQYWPGTAMFEGADVQGEGPLADTYRPSDEAAHAEALRREQQFYRRFYLRPRFVARMARHALSNPGDLWTGANRLVRYVLAPQREDFI